MVLSYVVSSTKLSMEILLSDIRNHSSSACPKYVLFSLGVGTGVGRSETTHIYPG